MSSIYAFFAASRNASLQLALNSSIQSNDLPSRARSRISARPQLQTFVPHEKCRQRVKQQLTLSIRENLQKFQQVRHGEFPGGNP
jgi:hypothetical protein